MFIYLGGSTVSKSQESEGVFVIYIRFTKLEIVT